MRLLLLCVFAFLTLVALGSAAEANGPYGNLEKTPAPQSCTQVKLKPAGQCGDEDECPFQITIPPLTIDLPKQFRLLEKTMKELQSLKETVRQLKSACLGCSLQGDSAEDGRGDGGARAPKNGSSNNAIQEMQVKMSKMSNSLKNARTQINQLQGRLDAHDQLAMKELEHIVDKKVENITGVITKLSSSCSTACPLEQGPIHIRAPGDCSDYSVMGQRKNGVYKITPSPKNGTFEVFCDMESNGGGWTVVQRRMDGSTNFNRTWAEYKKGFGDVSGEFWLGNDHIHLLTRARDMMLRIELEDLDGVCEYAKYEQFYVANEFLKYRLSLSGYSGTAGNALLIKDNYNHDQKSFTTWDKDNDFYIPGNCGSYYGSGWWFNACMSANLNGKYYHKKYTGKRDGIYWGTWHNISRENYPTSPRQTFKTVKMMIRPKNYNP